MMKKLLYFAYGSNLSQSRLEFRVGFVEVLENYTLNDYKLVFNCKGYANIEYSKGDYVEGTLYHITPDQISELNWHEGLYNAQYFDYKDYTVIVYIAKNKALQYYSRFIPDKSYLSIIIKGMKERGIVNTRKKLLLLKKNLYG